MPVQFRYFQVPAHGGTEAEQAVNHFLRTVRVLTVRHDFVVQKHTPCWCISVQGSCLAPGSIPEHFEDQFIDVLFPVIKAKFALFQMELEGMFTHSSETSQASFGIGPKALNAVDV